MSVQGSVARIEGITQRYGNTVALDAVTIELPAGCMIGFIGPDGARKVVTAEHHCRCATHPIRKRLRPRREHGRSGAPGRNLPPHRLYAARIGQESRCGPQRPRTSIFGRLFGQSRSERDRRIVAVARECHTMSVQGSVARIEGITQRYGNTVALDAVTIELPAGCMIGFIGPDGVGKSSLLSIIAGARRIQSGNAFVLDGSMADSGAPGRNLPRIAYMPQGLGKNSMRTSASARTSSFSAACSDNPVPNGTGKSPSFSTAPGSHPFPTVQRRNCPAACGRSSGSVAASSTIPIC